MSKSLTEAAKEILGGNVASKKAGQDAPKKLGGDAPTVLQPPKEPEDTNSVKDTAGRAKPPGMPAPIGDVGRDGRGDKLTPTTAAGGPEAPVSKPARGKLKDGVNGEEDGNDDLYEETEDFVVGDIVEDEDGNVGEVLAVNEETGELEIEWQSLSEAKDDEDEDEDEDSDEESEDDEDEDDDKEDKKDIKEESAMDKINFDLTADVTAMFAGQDDFLRNSRTRFRQSLKPLSRLAYRNMHPR